MIWKILTKKNQICIVIWLSNRIQVIQVTFGIIGKVIRSKNPMRLAVLNMEPRISSPPNDPVCT